MIWKDRGGEQSEHQSPGFVEEVSSLDRIESRVLLWNRGGGGTSQSEQRFGPWRPRMDWMDGATFLPFSSTIAPRCRVWLQRSWLVIRRFQPRFFNAIFLLTPQLLDCTTYLSRLQEHSWQSHSTLPKDILNRGNLNHCNGASLVIVSHREKYVLLKCLT